MMIFLAPVEPSSTSRPRMHLRRWSQGLPESKEANARANDRFDPL
jgi:hypothetical protein